MGLEGSHWASLERGQNLVLDGYDPSPGIAFVCSADGEEKPLGTAWLCGPNLALTAFHVVPKEGVVNVILNGRCKFVGECVDSNSDFDVALLALKANDSASEDVFPLALNDDGDMRPGDGWSAYGHPIGSPQGFTVDGTIASTVERNGPRRLMGLNCLHGSKENLRGMSGAPIFDKSRAVIGLIVEYPELLSNNTIFATRIDDAWRVLSGWRKRMPNWASQGRVSRYFDSSEQHWNSPSYHTPFVRIETPPVLSEVFVAQRFRPAGKTGPLNSRTMGNGLSAESVLEFLRKEGRHLIVRGDPGTGKSAFLRWLCTRVAKGWRDREDRRFVPALVHASELVRKDVDAAIAEINPLFEGPPPFGIQWLILIDGLDEVVNVEDRRTIVKRLKDRSAHGRSRARPSLRIVVASRPLAILNELPDAEVQHVVLEPFSAEQLKEFACNWFRSRGDHRATAEAFVDQLKESRIEGLAAVPALATMAAIVFERSNGKALPRQRSELYDRFIDVSAEERFQNDESWGRFVGECEKSYRGRGREIATGLREASEALATHIAKQIQDGAVSLACGDLVGTALHEAIALKLLPRERNSSVRADAARHIVSTLLLESGLFVAGPGREGNPVFVHNTLREALVARSLAGTLPSTAEEVWSLARRWNEPRWREIILLVLARWSEEGDNVREAIWSALKPLVLSSRRGCHFLGMAVGEGLRLPPDGEAAVVQAMLEAAESWNACRELFLEFSRPNPTDVLRVLARLPGFSKSLIDRLRQLSSKCNIQIYALLELTLDLESANGLRSLLNGHKSVAAAAAVLLAQHGYLTEVMDRLVEIAVDPEERGSARARVAEIIAEQGNEADALWFASERRFDPFYRLVVAEGAFRRFQSEAFRERVVVLLREVSLDADAAYQVSLAERILASGFRALDPGAVNTRTLATLLVAGSRLKDAPEWTEKLALAMLSDPQRSAEEQTAACLSLLALGCHGAEDRACTLLGSRGVGDGQRERLVVALASGGAADRVAATARDANHSVALRSSAARELARLGQREDALQILRSLRDVCARTDGSSIAQAYFAIGEMDQAVETLMDRARSANSPWPDFRGLMDLGRTEELVTLILDDRFGVAERLFGVRCLTELGSAEQLSRLASDSHAHLLVRMEAVRELAHFGWLQEARNAIGSIARAIEHPGGEEAEIRKAVVSRLMLAQDTPVALMIELADEMPENEWRSVLAGALKRDLTDPHEAIALMKKLGNDVNLDDAFARVGPGAADDALFELADTAAHLGRSDIAARCVAKAIELPQHNRYRAVTSGQLLVSCLRGSALKDPALGDHNRLKFAEEMMAAGESDGGASIYRSIAVASDSGGVTRLEAALGWHKAEQSADALSALVSATLACADVALQPATLEQVGNACEAVCGVEGHREVEPALVWLAGHREAGPAVRRRAALRLAEAGQGDRASDMLTEIADDTKYELGERVLAAWELADWRPDDAATRLAAFAQQFDVEKASIDELVDRRLAAKALVETNSFTLGAGALSAMRDAPNADQTHKRRCDEIRRIAMVRARRLKKETAVS